jgi:hypothetical protein
MAVRVRGDAIAAVTAAPRGAGTAQIAGINERVPISIELRHKRVSAGAPERILKSVLRREIGKRCDENQNLRGEISQLKAKLSETVEAEPCPPIEQRQPERHFDTVHE